MSSKVDYNFIRKFYRVMKKENCGTIYQYSDKKAKKEFELHMTEVYIAWKCGVKNLRNDYDISCYNNSEEEAMWACLYDISLDYCRWHTQVQMDQEDPDSCHKGSWGHEGPWDWIGDD